MTTTPRLAAGAIALGLAATLLAGCAPEPDTVSPDGRDLTEKVEPEGGSWAEPNPEEAYEKSAELPDDFPADFVVPEGAVVDDAGSRGFGSWYVVLRAPDQDTANTLWDAVVTGSGFAASDEAETGDGGRTATLVSPALEVTAVTMSGDDGAVLLSYDITQVVG
ncbi:hypothetical protein [Leucobacter aridicollis]|uniref:hypothetical protein n=1 Tax=Leucobacter aridicollis TaxID=283878 RepID=UPI002167B3E8|nr:hypothetical protein [Leucobacter aridicollis]MCS3428364.1 hypothetical protein [Leucobacter aridicollis]